MTNFIRSELSDKDVFTEIFYHDLDYHNDISEDFHSTQIKKAVIKEFLNFRLMLWAGIFEMFVNENIVLGSDSSLTNSYYSKAYSYIVFIVSFYVSIEVYRILLNEPPL